MFRIDVHLRRIEHKHIVNERRFAHDHAHVCVLLREHFSRHSGHRD